MKIGGFGLSPSPEPVRSDCCDSGGPAGPRTDRGGGRGRGSADPSHHPLQQPSQQLQPPLPRHSWILQTRWSSVSGSDLILVSSRRILAVDEWAPRWGGEMGRRAVPDPPIPSNFDLWTRSVRRDSVRPPRRRARRGSSRLSGRMEDKSARDRRGRGQDGRRFRSDTLAFVVQAAAVLVPSSSART